MFRINNEHSQQRIFDNTQWMNRSVLKLLEESWAAYFYECVFCHIEEQPFAVLYGSTGKPNFPVNILLSLEYIKQMKDCNDLELLDAYRFDYQVNYALGIRVLGERHLAERTLYYFRERIYDYCLESAGNEELIFGQFKKLLQCFQNKIGLKMEEQRTDTTMFMSNIKKAGRMALAYDVLVKAVDAIPVSERSEDLAKVLEPSFKTDVLYRCKGQETETTLGKLLNLCKNALDILTTKLNRHHSDEVRILKRFLADQSININTDGKLVPKPAKEIKSDSLQSAYDEDATFRKKGDVKQSGYVLQLSETCSKTNEVQLITDYAVKPNISSDVSILKERLPEIRDNTNCTDMYVDGGFHSEEVHKTAATNGIEIHLTNMSGTEPRKKMAVSEFAINETSHQILQCPAGYTPFRTGTSDGQTTAHFLHEQCSNCPMRERCFSRSQKKDCVVRISLKAIQVDLERTAMKASQYENTTYRAAIEGTNSALKRKGLRKLKVRGLIKSTLICGLMATAQNIKRTIKFLQGGYAPKMALSLPMG